MWVLTLSRPSQLFHRIKISVMKLERSGASGGRPAVAGAFSKRVVDGGGLAAHLFIENVPLQRGRFRSVGSVAASGGVDHFRAFTNYRQHMPVLDTRATSQRNAIVMLWTATS